ncbi:Chitin-binding protein CbpD [BD1-7 clade bacterium]|uniref:Chitin-binding protein CbpD n=1 Tax=BD1-7 clade bacterium TaxID=2029982 RepID=A0A5S9P7J0_9GAMM|nr:Chitin-binding protein CbpD [BD1-7 clade bacterium]CAA0099602.1 Chitin-binding protein CbpD [BD1-7 clade bacterium]
MLHVYDRMCPNKMRTVEYAVYAVLALIISLISTQVFAHGYNLSPTPARQIMCKNQGSNNQTCQTAIAINPGAIYCPHCINGSIRFTSSNYDPTNEYLPLNTEQELQLVKDSIVDGSLCSGGGGGEGGRGKLWDIVPAPGQDWLYTDVTPGTTMRLDYSANVPHNPSFWQIFVSKPGYDPRTAKLTWNDLELVKQIGNISTEGGVYPLRDIKLPSNRSGRAILYTRWQRYDAAGEGFYNCSDINFVGGDPDPDPDPDPTEPPADWPVAEIGKFVNVELVAEAGDTVVFELRNSSGAIVNETELLVQPDITETAKWAEQLAIIINANNMPDVLTIGQWHAEMNHIMYMPGDPWNNLVWAPKDDTYAARVYVEKGDDPDPTPGNPVAIGQFVKESDDGKAKPGDTVVLKVTDENRVPVVNKTLSIVEGNTDIRTWAQQLASMVNMTPDTTIFVGTQTADDTIEFDPTNVFSNQVWAPNVSYGFTLVVSNNDPVDPPPGEELPPLYDYDYPDSMSTYRGGMRVRAEDGLIYECRGWPTEGWCTQAAYSPTGTYSDQAWFPVNPADDPTEIPGGTPEFDHIWQGVGGDARYASGVRVFQSRGTPGAQGVYECLGYPNSGWCQQRAYAPAVSGAWGQAWRKVGPNEGVPPEDLPDYQYTYPENRENYASGVRVYQPRGDSGVYQCKPFPFGGWCVQDAYAPGVSQFWQQAWDKVPAPANPGNGRGENPGDNPGGIPGDNPSDNPGSDPGDEPVLPPSLSALGSGSIDIWVLMSLMSLGYVVRRK